MTLRTGKSGRYRYYTCASCAHRGKAVYQGRTVPMDRLDQLVLDAFADQVLAPDRLGEIIRRYVETTATADAGRKERLYRLKGELTEAQGAKNRLLQLVMNGALLADDPDLAAKLKQAEERRQQAERQLALLETQAPALPKKVTPEKLARIGHAIRTALAEGDPAFRRAYVRLFISKVTVGDEEIRITGPTAALIRASSEGNPSQLAAVGSQFHPDWRPIGDGAMLDRSLEKSMR